jgi:hypothetical protein
MIRIELRRRADADEWPAVDRLTKLVAGPGRVDEAIDVLRPLAHAGDWVAAKRLTGLLVQQNRVEEL